MVYVIVSYRLLQCVRLCSRGNFENPHAFHDANLQPCIKAETNLELANHEKCVQGAGVPRYGTRRCTLKVVGVSGYNSHTTDC